MSCADDSDFVVSDFDFENFSCERCSAGASQVGNEERKEAGRVRHQAAGSRQHQAPKQLFHQVQCILNNIEVPKRKMDYSIDRDEVGSRLRLSI